ncbi:MAG: hypothetical protein JSW07_22015 [bacterium]|nr:MAG: hypothetical protein JSW07_22015 [bacterium]
MSPELLVIVGTSGSIAAVNSSNIFFWMEKYNKNYLFMFFCHFFSIKRFFSTDIIQKAG